MTIKISSSYVVGQTNSKKSLFLEIHIVFRVKKHKIGERCQCGVGYKAKGECTSRLSANQGSLFFSLVHSHCFCAFHSE